MIIGLSGKTGTGKSTIAREIAEIIADSGGRTEILPFALVLKRECARRFNFPLGLTMSQDGKSQIIFHPDVPNGRMTVRRIMQWYGTDVCRRKDPDHWVKTMSVLVDGIKSGTMIIIDDIRFPNEAEFVLGRGGYLVRVHPHDDWHEGDYAGHDSETALDQYQGWSFELCPEHGLPALRNVADYICRTCHELRSDQS